MKKLISMIVVLTVIMLSGCSFLEEANKSLDYANKATEYINELTTFAEEVPTLEGAELESRLKSLRDTIKEFMEIDPPSFAEEIHSKLESKSQVLLDASNKILESGEVAIEKLEQTEIYKTIDNITSLMDQIEQLGL